MDPNLLTVIISHGGFPKAHENNMPLWEKHGQVASFFPERSLSGDAPASFFTKNSIAYGDAAKGAPLSTERFRWLLRYLLTKTQSKWFLLYTQHTIGLAEDIPQKYYTHDMLYGAWPPTPIEPGMDRGNPNWPLFFSRAIGQKLLDAMEKQKEDNELKIWSGMVGFLAAKGDVPTLPWGLAAFSRDVIKPSDETTMLAAIEGVEGADGRLKPGAIFVHGLSSSVMNNRLVRMCMAMYARNRAGVPYLSPRKSFKIEKNANPVQVVQGTPGPGRSSMRPAFSRG